MYGLSEEVIGYCLARVDDKSALFSASKVWTPGRGLGISQMESSAYLWDLPRFDLMQIHNLVDWKTHIKTLKKWKQNSKVRYIGITTSHGRHHHELEDALKSEAFDFVQLTYNVLDRRAEQRLLPLAAERGIAVIANRPFQGGVCSIRSKVSHCQAGLLTSAATTGAVVSQVCGVAPAGHLRHTRHFAGNSYAGDMIAGYGELPDARLRTRLANYVQTII